MTVPLILHENQRLDVRLKTLATSAGRPRFTTSVVYKLPAESALIGVECELAWYASTSKALLTRHFQV